MIICVGKDFSSSAVNFIARTVSDFFKKMSALVKDNRFDFTLEFRIKFTVDVLKCSANEFIKLKAYFQENFHPLAEIRKKEAEMLTLFKNICKGEVEKTAADWIVADILKWIQKVVATNSSRWIRNIIANNESCCLNKKQNFFAQLLIDIGEDDVFGLQKLYQAP